LFIASLTKNAGIGYMISTVYFIFDMMAKGKYTKKMSVYAIRRNIKTTLKLS